MPLPSLLCEEFGPIRSLGWIEYEQNALDLRHDLLGREKRRTRRVIEHLIALYEAWDRPDAAADARALLPSSEEDNAARPSPAGLTKEEL